MTTNLSTTSPLAPTPAAEASFLAAFAQIRHAALDLHALLTASLALLIESLPGSACAYLYLFHEGQLTLAAHYPASLNRSNPRLDLAAQVVEYLKPITIMLAQPTAYVPILGLPILDNAQPLGALIIQAATRIYNDADTALLHLAARTLATTIATTANQPFH